MFANKEQRKRRKKALTYFIPAFGVGYFTRKNAFPNLLPYGSAVEVPKETRPVFSKVDFENDSLRMKYSKLKKIFERVEDGKEPLFKGSETIVVDQKNGDLYGLTEDANLIRMDEMQQVDENKLTARSSLVMSLGVGRPLGGVIVENDMYIADALLGLIRVQNFNKGKDNGPKPKVELLASRVQDKDGKWSKILFADDVDVGPKTGMIYFSDASEIMPDRIGTETWDILYASKLDYARGKRTGRLLRYDPKTNQVKVLASGIWFANGIAVDKEERFVMVSETFAGRSLKYHLEGRQKGTIQVMADEFPGYPDGATCSAEKFYTSMVLAEDSIMRILAKIPHPVDTFLRTLLMMLPKSLAPDAKRYGGIVEMTVEPNGKTSKRIIQDPTGQDIAFITGVTHHNGKLYLGSHTNDFIGVYDLN